MTRICFPNIKLFGSVKYWKNIQLKCAEIKKLDIGLEFGLEHLIPVIDNIVKSVKILSKGKLLNQQLIEFWNSIYNFRSMSGGSAVTGWAKTLFPYIGSDNRQNGELDWKKGGWPHVS
eukprot:7894_1